MIKVEGLICKVKYGTKTLHKRIEVIYAKEAMRNMAKFQS
jgi:hypothetical protein